MGVTGRFLCCRAWCFVACSAVGLSLLHFSPLDLDCQELCL